MFIISLFVMMVTATTIFFAQTTEEKEAYRTISVVEVSGKVSVVKDGVEYAAYPGMLLHEGHEIVTSGNSYVRLVLDDDKYVKLEAGSKLVFETLGFMGSGKTRMNLQRGSLTSELVHPLGEDDEFVVNTPNAVLAVRGTFFRVDLNIRDNGEIRADVMTYGGQVASQRIMPTGEIVDEEVLIDAGFKAVINMTQEDTHYIVETEEGETIIVEPSVPQDVPDEEEILVPTVPITTVDIPDDDLVDVYFAAENGHELFVTAEEAKADIEVREINLEEKTSVYEKAEEVKIEQEAIKAREAGVSNTTSASAVANDSKSIVMAPEIKEEPKTGTSNNTSASSGNNQNKGPTTSNLVTDGDAHIHEKANKRVDATCTTAGKDIIYCRTCNKNLSVTEVPALGHNYASTYTIDTEATCTTAGARSRHCSRCESATDKSVIAALGHDYASTFTVDVAETCTTDGSQSRHCSRCSAKTDETVLAATGHNYSEWNRTKEPSCTGKGEDTRACAKCNDTQKQEVAPLGHDYASTFTVDKEATCTANGSKSKHCSRCSSVSETTQIAMLGHDYREKQVAPSDTQNGRTYEECQNCGDEINEEIIIAINEINFPDIQLRNYVERNFNTDGLPGLTDDEMMVAGAIQFEASTQVTTLQGIEYFPALEVITLSDASAIGDGDIDVTGFPYLRNLALPYSSISTLDVSNNPNLENLMLSYSEIQNLDLSNNDKLQYLYVAETPITDLDVSGKSSLLYLIASDSNLTNLDMTGCTSLTNLQIANTNVEELELTTLSALYEFYAPDTKIKELDLSNNTNLVTMTLDRSDISTIDVRENINLTTLSVQNCTSLTRVNAAQSMQNRSQLNSLFISGCTSLTRLDLDWCQKLQLLDTTDAYELQYLQIAHSGITDFNNNTSVLSFASNPNLDTIYADGLVSFTGVDLSLNNKLKTFSYQDNENITDLDLSNKPYLESVYIYDMPNLVRLDISDCPKLYNLNLSSLTGLEELVARDCTTLKNLTLNTGVNRVYVNGATSMTKLDISGLTSLQELDISNSGIYMIDAAGGSTGLIVSPTNTATVKAFNSNGTGIDISLCTVDQLNWLASVEYVGLGGQNMEDQKFLDAMGKLPTTLKQLDLSGSSMLGSITIDMFPNLEKLYVRDCENLQFVTVTVETGNDLTVYNSGCTSLTDANIVVQGATLLLDRSSE